MSAKEKEIKYGKAMEELEGILKRIEQEEVDIDDLAQEVKRASELIQLCKKKIEKTEMEVNRIVQSFEAELPSSESDNTISH